MSHKVDLVRVLTAATGNSSTITLGAAYSQLFMNTTEAGCIDGRVYTWLIVDSNNWELVKGAYSAAGPSMNRTTVLQSRSGGTLGTSRISLSGTAQVRIVAAAEDIDGVRGTRSVVGTSDALINTDQGYVVTYSNASAVAVSLGQAGASNQFLDGWAAWTQNLGAGAVTITPTTSTINGAASLVLAQNLGAFIWSDGTNYHAYIIPITRPLLAGNNLADVASKVASMDNLSIHGADIPSAATLNLDAATGNYVHVTGSATISAITLTDGRQRTIYFTGAPLLTNGANLVLPGGGRTSKLRPAILPCSWPMAAWCAARTINRHRNPARAH